MKAMKVAKKVSKVARMDLKNRALCYALRHPATGKPTKYTDIVKLVQKTDGSKPTVGAIQECVATYNKVKKPVGRPEGWRKTTKAEDKQFVQTLHKVRPPGFLCLCFTDTHTHTT